MLAKSDCMFVTQNQKLCWSIYMTPIEGHAHLPSEIKKIIPFDHSSPTADVGSYFESVLQDEEWIRVKMDQMVAQFVACGLNQP